MKCGNTVLLYDDDDPDSPPHLHIVITDPDDADDCVVLVSVTTRRARSDTMTPLDPGEHPFIDRPSVVTYAYSKLLRCAHIERLVASGHASKKADASERIVLRAQQGMLETDRAPQEVREFFIAWWERCKTSD